MICAICFKPITPDQEKNEHHPVHKSLGGTTTIPLHKNCHVGLHRGRGDFREWGKISAVTRAWAFNLKNVRTHPAYEFDRQYYLALYAH